MELYTYKGISAGKYIEGEIEALNQDEASHKLKEQKVIITNLVRSNKKKDKKKKKKGDGFSLFKQKIKPQDKDWRGTGKTYKDALDDAFKETGLDKVGFEVTTWSKSKDGKSFPVEYRHKSGAEVNIDYPHQKNGPDTPHVGWQTPGKRGNGGAVRGHIILDEVPYGR